MILRWKLDLDFGIRFDQIPLLLKLVRNIGGQSKLEFTLPDQLGNFLDQLVAVLGFKFPWQRVPEVSSRRGELPANRLGDKGILSQTKGFVFFENLMVLSMICSQMRLVITRIISRSAMHDHIRFKVFDGNRKGFGSLCCLDRGLDLVSAFQGDLLG